MAKQHGERGRMTITFLLAICISLINKGAIASPRYQENFFDEDNHSPGFLTIGQKYSIAIGSTVVLPCKINETEHTGHVLAWKHGIAVLTAGDVKVTSNPRIRLMPPQQGIIDTSARASHSNSYNLEIQNVRMTDAGDYACQIGSIVPKEIVHSLEVLVPPKIDYVAPSTRVDVPKGASIKLECRASGNPLPKVYWTRKNNVLPNGEPNSTNNILEMMHADRHTVGHYRCTADNRVGQPDGRDIFVNVLYAPEIEVERPFVHTGVGHEAQLICVVHAEPQAHVIWYKETTQIGTTEQLSQQSRGNRHTLTIRNVTYNDLGNYTCQASNNLGKDRASLTLSGIPSVCTFDSPTLSNHRDQYNITWVVQSYAPILEYRLFYRKQTANGNVNPTSNNDVIHYEKYPNNHNNFLSTSQFHGVYERHAAEWENIVIPQMHHQYSNQPIHPYQHMTNNHNSRHRMSYLIKSLAPSSNYEARVQARNDHGWNKLSSIFHFSTRAEDLEMEPSAQPAVAKTAGVFDKDAHSRSSVIVKSLTKKFSIFICVLSIALCL
ncbi:neural cell adhesion molecule 1-like [Sitodiplosis mosellana]|uniref:neural cell adhesion molecule 1-like n=1 Tax=Sitodiplosis mosellana TaxID=263140 RepID=UPI002444BF5F|nr:neural cell adhesion molecule 1-like [Sitodiplosis mosellana]